MNACSCAGIASPLLPGILLTLAAQAQEAAPGAKAATLPKITQEMLDQAAELAGVGPFTAEQKKMMLDGLNDQRDAYAQIRALKLTNDVPPAYVFHPGKAATGSGTSPCPPNEPSLSALNVDCGGPGCERYAVAPKSIEDLAFATVDRLGLLLSYRKITSLALTQMYIDRLKRYDAKLHFVITLTEERAHCAGQKSRRGDCRGKISRAAAWDSVGREGSAGCEGLPDDVGRGRV